MIIKFKCLFYLSLVEAVKPLPGKVIGAYTQGADEARIAKAVASGVNVLFWSFISYDGEINGLGGPTLAAVQKAHPDVVNIASIGGWNAPFPSPLEADQFVKKFVAWNADKKFDGLDWDLEGNDDVDSPFNKISEELIKFMCDTSAALQRKKLHVAIVPANSYLDVGQNGFDTSLLHPAPWKSDFKYHGKNSYAPLLLCFTPNLVILQVYESWSRVQHEYKDPSYMTELAKNLTEGWEVDFNGFMNKNKEVVKVPSKSLVIGLAGGGWAESKNFFLKASDVPWPCSVRGFAYWSLKHDAKYAKNLPTVCKDDDAAPQTDDIQAPEVSTKKPDDISEITGTTTPEPEDPYYWLLPAAIILGGLVFVFGAAVLYLFFCANDDKSSPAAQPGKTPPKPEIRETVSQMWPRDELAEPMKLDATKKHVDVPAERGKPKDRDRRTSTEKKKDGRFVKPKLPNGNRRPDWNRRPFDAAPLAPERPDSHVRPKLFERDLRGEKPGKDPFNAKPDDLRTPLRQKATPNKKPALALLEEHAHKPKRKDPSLRSTSPKKWGGGIAPGGISLAFNMQSSRAGSGLSRSSLF